MSGLILALLTAPAAAQTGCTATVIGSLAGTPQPWVSDLRVHDDGSGAALFACGRFTNASGTAANYVARWNGGAWSALGAGLGGYHPRPLCMEVFDDGSGPALFVAGSFEFAGGLQILNIARWSGATWSALGPGLPPGMPPSSYALVRALLAFDDGSGPALYAGGRFTTAAGAPADHLARWDGSTWGPVGGAFDNQVWALAEFDDGTGPALFAAGVFTSIGGVAVSALARWDGTSWSPVGGGLGGPPPFPPVGKALAVFDDGTGPALFVGGIFSQAGGIQANSIAKWDGTSWSPLGLGLAWSFSPPEVLGMEVLDDGSGPALYVFGNFDTAGSLSIPHGLARWDGASWSPVPSLASGGPMAVFDDGAGPDLYAVVKTGAVTTPASIHRLSCTGTTSISATQPGGPGSPIFINNANLSPGREYYNVFSVEIVGLPGSGPYLGLHASPGPNLDFLVLQAQLPVGTAPFHFVAPESYIGWGPFPLGPATIDAACFDFTGGTISAVSPVARITIL